MFRSALYFAARLDEDNSGREFPYCTQPSVDESMSNFDKI